MPIRIHSARPSDALFLGDRLREHDVTEVLAMGSHPYDALIGGLKGDVCFTALDIDDQFGNETPVMMFGATVIEPNVAAIWALGSDEVRKHPVTLYRQGHIWLAQLAAATQCDVLFNYVSVDNEPAITWLARLGADFDEETTEFGGEDFVRFEFKKEDLCAPQS